MNAKIPCLLAVTLALGACQSEPPRIDTASKPKLIEGAELYKVENSRADLAYIDKNVDFSRYNTVYIDTLNYSKLKIVQPATSPGSKPFEFTERAQLKFVELYREAMIKQLSENQGYRIVSTPQADSLVVTTYLLELRPNATNYSNRDISARSKVFSQGSGSMTIGTIFKDGGKNSVVAMIEDEKKSLQIWEENTPTSNIRDTSLMFNSWARALRQRLDELHGKAR